MATSSADFAGDELGIRREPFTRVMGSFFAAWAYPLLRPRWTHGLLLAVVAALCALRAFFGLIDSRQYSHDLFMFLDGAWRMANGQHPHIDFYSHLGFLTYLPIVFGFKLSHGSAWGMAYGYALVGLLIGVWAYLLGRRRLADVPLVLFCLCITFLALAPFALGEPVLQVSYAMTYNRFGYALLALVLLEGFTAAHRPSSELAAGISTGLILGILLFLKITYFAFAVFLLLALIPCRRQTGRRWAGIAAGFLLLFVLCSAYFNFNLLPMLRDLRTIAGGKHIRFRAYLLDDILFQVLAMLVFTACAALLLHLEGRRRRALMVGLAGVLIALTGTALILGNFEESGFPLGAFWALIVIDELIERPVVQTAFDYFRFSVLLVGCLFIAGSLFSGSIATITALVGHIHTPPALHSPMLRGFIPAGEDRWYGDFVNDGLALIQEFERPGDTVMCLDFSNPFSYGLGLKPAPGGTTVLQYKTTFDDTHLQSPQYLFGSAQLVMVPVRFSDLTLEGTIARIYGPYLNSHFHLVGTSKAWSLYRHN